MEDKKLMSSVTWFGRHIVFNMKIFKKMFSEMAGQIEAKLYRYDYLSMRNKKFFNYENR